MLSFIDKLKPYIDQLKQSLGGVVVGDVQWFDLLLAFIIIFITLAFQRIIAKSLLGKLKRITAKTKSTIDDEIVTALEKPLIYFILILGMFFALNVLPLHPDVDVFVNNVFRGVSTLVIVWSLMRTVDALTATLSVKLKDKGSTFLGFIPLVKKSLRILIIIVGAILVMDNLGYSVSGIVTTLGLGGAAFALAAKDTIANLYGSLSIVLDRPFKVGDWIVVGSEIDGDVESIGFRSTKVRTWPKTQLTIPNNYLANQVINNWARMPKRRVKQIVGVTYDANPDQLEGLVNDIRDLIKQDDGVEQSFLLVQFIDFGESSLDILVYYFTTTIAWIPHMEIRERINLKIMRAIEAKGLSVAFPTRTIHVKKEDDSSASQNLPGDFGPTMPM